MTLVASSGGALIDTSILCLHQQLHLLIHRDSLIREQGKVTESKKLRYRITELSRLEETSEPIESNC